MPIEHQPVGTFAHGQLTHGLSQCLSPTHQCRFIQGAANHRLILAIKPVAPLVTKALAIFEPAQLFDHAQ
ncbi:hypothetical protein D3C81_1845050 [compost metagenome]